MHYVGGTISTKDWAAFSRLIFRVSRGNCLIQSGEVSVEDSNKIIGEPDYFEAKTVFLLAFEHGSHSITKIMKIIDSNTFKDCQAAQIRVD